MFGALLLESSAGISLQTKQKSSQMKLDRQKVAKQTQITVFRQKRKRKNKVLEKRASKLARARPAGVVRGKITQNYFFRSTPNERKKLTRRGKIYPHIRDLDFSFFFAKSD